MFFENVAGKMDANSLKPKKKDKTEKSPKIIGVKETECELAACRSFLAADQIDLFERRSKANFKKHWNNRCGSFYTTAKGLNQAICYMYIFKKIKPVFASISFN